MVLLICIQLCKKTLVEWIEPTQLFNSFVEYKRSFKRSCKGVLRIESPDCNFKTYSLVFRPFSLWHGTAVVAAGCVDSSGCGTVRTGSIGTDDRFSPILTIKFCNTQAYRLVPETLARFWRNGKRWHWRLILAQGWHSLKTLFIGPSLWRL